MTPSGSNVCRTKQPPINLRPHRGRTTQTQFAQIVEKKEALKTQYQQSL